MIGRGSGKAAKAPRRLRARPPGCAWGADVRVNRSGRFAKWGICKAVGSRGESAKRSVRDVSVQQNHCQSNHISPQAQAWGLAALSGRGPVANLQNLFSRRGALAPRKFCPPATIYVRKSLLAVY